MSQINEGAIRTPGVYTTEIPTFPPSVAQVSSAIPVFIGYTQLAQDEVGASLNMVPTKIFSLKNFELYFGFADNETGISVNININTTTGTSIGNATISNPSVHNMYYSLRLYFDNGGGPCYIISIGNTPSPLSPDDFIGGLNVLAASDEPTIIVFPEGQSLAEAAYYNTVINQAIEQCRVLQDRFTLVDIHHSLPVSIGSPIEPSPVNTTSTIDNFRTAFARNTDLNYAAAYYPNLKTTLDYSYLASDVDINITTDEVVEPTATLDTFQSSRTSIYNLAIDRIRTQLSPTLPPSPAIAGIYAKVDGSRGVWKAPANVSVNSIYGVTDFITDAEQDTMNIDPDTGKSVNAIRPFTGKGILVWGARTLEGNSNEWKYISVRRFFIMVEESAKKATFPFVFEPNDANTWIKVRAMLENYLTLLWRQGALAGAKPEHAFFVRCGLGQTMTSQDILEGRLIVEIGMAAVRPAEFIILRFSHKLQES
ncbi:MAG: phage tail sheath C-terminal domain-containing protein [Cyclobacteriaceae bacterium]